jgi:hypothetical protein
MSDPVRQIVRAGGLRLRWIAGAACVALACVTLGVLATASTPEDGFWAENDAAMQKMMAGMEIKPSGDVDRDFAVMMIPHHQGAIDMAVAELRFGKNEQLRRIAQEIIVEQQQEIAAMRVALGEPAPAPQAVPTQFPVPGSSAPVIQGHHHHH